MLMMPLQFKGGATESHPHAFFQFWSDIEAAPHHHGFDEESGDPHKQHEHEHPAALMKRSLLDAQNDDPSSVETSVGPPGLVGIGQVAGFALTLFLAALFITSDRALDRLSVRATLIGRSVLPPEPPPRLPGRFAN